MDIRYLEISRDYHTDRLFDLHKEKSGSSQLRCKILIEIMDREDTILV